MRPLAVALLAAAATTFTAGATPLAADEPAYRLPIGDPARKDKETAIVVDAIADTLRDDLVTPAELCARLSGVQLLFVGESHTDMDVHRVQLRVLQELQACGRQVLVGLEMLPVSEQAALDRWHSEAGLGEEEFLRASRWYRNWGYHWGYYRDIFRFARSAGIRMFGVNVPRAVVQAVRMKGVDALAPEQKKMLPPRIDTDNAEQRKLFRAFFRPEDSLHGNLPEPALEGMLRAQCTWDAAMGWNAVQALRRHGGEKAIMVVLVGSGHVAYGLGAERQAKLWFEGRTASLVPIAVSDRDHSEVVTHVQSSYADFLWGLPPTSDPLYPSLGISIPEQKADGRYEIILVQPDSPAAAAGFAVGDDLVSCDGVPIEDKETSSRLMADKRWGDSVACMVLRDGREVKLTAYLRRQPPKGPSLKPASGPDPR